MNLHDLAPWAPIIGVVCVSGLGHFVQFKLFLWRISAIEKWKEDRDKSIAEYQRWRGAVDEKLRTMEHHDHDKG